MSNNGPRILPCGTPEVTGRRPECWPLRAGNIIIIIIIIRNFTGQKSQNNEKDKQVKKDTDKDLKGYQELALAPRKKWKRNRINRTSRTWADSVKSMMIIRIKKMVKFMNKKFCGRSLNQISRLR